jgi:hypothetical protein
MGRSSWWSSDQCVALIIVIPSGSTINLGVVNPIFSGAPLF